MNFELILEIDYKETLEIDEGGIRAVVERVLSESGEAGKIAVEVSFVGDEEMMSLHEQYMETYETTDVLSFPLEEGVGPDGVKRLGNVVVCVSVAKRQAAENVRSIQEEVEFLVEHSCWHLLGRHHE